MCDLTLRSWVCVKCGATCLSKSPGQRNVHGEGTGGFDSAMYMSVLRNRMTVSMEPAKPARPKEEVYVLNSGSKFCHVDWEDDIVLRITPPMDVRSTKPRKTRAQELMDWLKFLRDAEERHGQELIAAYLCVELDGGHSWSDDTEDIEKYATKKIKASAE